MSDYRVGVVVGSLRRDSFNRKLAAAVENSDHPSSPSGNCKSATCRSITRMMTQTLQSPSGA